MSQRGQYYGNDNRTRKSNRRDRKSRSQNYNAYQGQNEYQNQYQSQSQYQNQGGQGQYGYQTQPRYGYQNQNPTPYPKPKPKPNKQTRKQYQDRPYQAYDPDSSNYETPNEKKRHSQKDKDLISIDGSMMEGGGQILRNCTALSALLHKAIYVRKIRGKRSNPGLRKQHSKGIELIQQINGGILSGNYIKSTQITYYPSKKQSFNNNYSIDIETAGSVCLLIQTCFPLFLYAPFQCKLTIMGGTNASFAPQIDYFILVLQPMLKRLMNISVSCEVLKRGFYPKGGGKVVVLTEPLKGCIPAFDLTKRGRIKKIFGKVVVAGRDLDCTTVGNAMIAGAVRELRMCFGTKIPIKIDIVPKAKGSPSLSSGIGMTVVAETDKGCLFGGSSLGDYGAINKKKRGVRGGSYGNKPYAHNVDNENISMYYGEVGRRAVKELITDWNSSATGCTDRWLQDQLIIFMALAKGRSRLRTCTLEMHAKTAIYISEMMTGVKFEILQQRDGTVLIECDGIGYVPQHCRGKELPKVKPRNDDFKAKEYDETEMYEEYEEQNEYQNEYESNNSYINLVNDTRNMNLNTEEPIQNYKRKENKGVYVEDKGGLFNRPSFI